MNVHKPHRYLVRIYHFYFYCFLFFVAAVYQDDDTLEDPSYIKIHSRVSDLHQCLLIPWAIRQNNGNFCF